MCWKAIQGFILNIVFGKEEDFQYTGSTTPYEDRKTVEDD